ncbi:MAG TPA: hypothetical protein VF187_11680 [Gemmatimonadales bacterium]
MSKWVGWIGATVGGLAGGWLGSLSGVFLGFVLGVFGTGVGLYAGRRVAATME